MTSDHRVVGLSPAGCNSLISNDLYVRRALRRVSNVTSPYLVSRCTPETTTGCTPSDSCLDRRDEHVRGVKTNASGLDLARFDEGPATYHWAFCAHAPSARSTRTTA